MQWKDSIGRLRRKPLGFISSPLFGKGLFAVSGWWLGTMYMYHIMYTTKYVKLYVKI